jgi:glycosyltransferase involved in cell wall biosynthesis
MRILMASNHRYPSFRSVGSGLAPTEFPSGSGGHIQDLLARGLNELGHQVFYLLRRGCEIPLPEGIEFVSDPIDDADIYQTTGAPGAELVSAFATERGLPWVLTCHLDRTGSSGATPAGDNWIFVSRSLARTYRKSRVVLNGLDPADFLYSASKEPFLLFMAPAERALVKGLNTAIAVSKRAGIGLVVAGTGGSHEAIERLAAVCREGGADYIGDIRGTAKAQWLAAAKAVILPSQTNEGCPLTLIEALMSGTPVLASDAGGIPEVVSRGVGYLCRNEDDYVHAVARLDEISSERCRSHALEHFHYQRMVRDYVSEFEHEIARQADCHNRR